MLSIEEAKLHGWQTVRKWMTFSYTAIGSIAKSDAQLSMCTVATDRSNRSANCSIYSRLGTGITQWSAPLGMIRKPHALASCTCT